MKNSLEISKNLISHGDVDSPSTSTTGGFGDVVIPAPATATLAGNISEVTLTFDDSYPVKRFHVQFQKNAAFWIDLETFEGSSPRNYNPASAPINASGGDSLELRVRVDTGNNTSDFKETPSRIL